MKKTFALGAAAGMSSLALAVPLLAQLAGAASSDTVSSGAATQAQHVHTRECVEALAAHDDFMLSGMDAMVVAHKAATIAHRDALRAAATITDDEQREAAVKNAHAALRAAIRAAMEGQGDKTAQMEELHAACDDAIGFHGMMLHGLGPMGGKGFMMKFRHGPDDLAEKLGMTADELKAAIESGKTIEQIAEEKGVDLPARPMRDHMMKFDEAAAVPVLSL